MVVYILYKSGSFSFFVDKERIKSFLISLGPSSFIGFIFFQALQVVVAPIPGEVTGFLGGVLYGKGLGIFLSTIGLTLGSLIAFSLSRMLGRPFVERFVKKETMEKYDYLLHHKGAFLVFLLFLVPGFPKDILCYILGLGYLTTKEFFVISTVGRFGGTVLLTLGGDYIRHYQYYRFSILLGVAIVVIFFSMVYKDKLARLFRVWHITSRRRTRKAKKR
ncbi:MAG: hypothetical protein A2Z09_06325 [Nitrospirae bacterium RBG_16_43_8]|nr:MAG: hypothetical protein A2Z09_06325 [Nitrospirae bacterium RBG_16_43_8]